MGPAKLIAVHAASNAAFASLLGRLTGHSHPSCAQVLGHFLWQVEIPDPQKPTGTGV